jgi:hypothetical protein
VRIPSWDEVKSFFLTLFLKILPFISGVLIVGFELYRHFMGKATDTAQMTVILGVGLFLIVLAQFEKLQELSVLGLTVKLKETIKEAEATIEQVKELALLLGQPLSEVVLKVGTWNSGFSIQELIDYRHKLEEYYQRMGVPQTKIDVTFNQYNKMIRLRYAFEILKAINNLVNKLRAEGTLVDDKGASVIFIQSLNNALTEKSKEQYKEALERFEELSFPDEATKAEVLKNIQIIGAYINDEELPSCPS